MILDQDTLRMIFGLKLRSLRLEKNLSLKNLGQISGMSPSYLNEIEKGKKYPKSDKIRELATALQVKEEDLTSLQLGEEMTGFSELLKNNLLQGLPFEVLGIPRSVLSEFMAERPSQLMALVGSCLELARTHEISQENFFAAALRAHIDVNGNFFEDIETEVDEFRSRYQVYGGGLHQNPQFLESTQLCRFLEQKFNYRISHMNFAQIDKDLEHLYYVYHHHGVPHLTLHESLSEREKVFILVKEMAFTHLGLKERPHCSHPLKIESFDQVYNNFVASYFSSALLIPRMQLVRETQWFIQQQSWSPEQFLSWASSYRGTLESFIHRLSQVLPKFFNMEKLFLLRLNHSTSTGEYSLVRELHLSQLHSPRSVITNEHHCRRWITATLPRELSQQRVNQVAGAQISSFWGTEDEYLCFSLAFVPDGTPELRTCVTLGLLLDETTRERIRFVDDPRLTKKTVSSTCERCGVSNCGQRVEVSSVLYRQTKEERQQKALDQLFFSITEGEPSVFSFPTPTPQTRRPELYPDPNV